jgi:hypothetical protein
VSNYATEFFDSFDVTAHSPLKRIAVKTEGFLGLCASSEQMTRVINLILDNILRNADAKQVLDVLVIVDSTPSVSERVRACPRISMM